MDLKYKALSEVGFNIDEMLENMCYDDNVVMYILKTFLKDENYIKLCKSIEEKDYETAFFAAHTLKGVLSNLAVKNLHILCSNIVEKLRNKDYDNIDLDFKEFCNLYDEVLDTIMEVCDE